MTGEWRKLHNVELNDLYCSPSIVRVIQSRRMRWAGHVARVGGRRGVTGFWLEYRSEGDRLEGVNVFGRIILEWIFMKLDVGALSELIWIRIEMGGGLLLMWL